MIAILDIVDLTAPGAPVLIETNYGTAGDPFRDMTVIDSIVYPVNNHQVQCYNIMNPADVRRIGIYNFVFDARVRWQPLSIDTNGSILAVAGYNGGLVLLRDPVSHTAAKPGWRNYR